jgi:hypothetical protein
MPRGEGNKQRRSAAAGKRGQEEPVAAMEGVEVTALGVEVGVAAPAGTLLYAQLYASTAAQLVAGEPLSAESCVGLLIGGCPELGPFDSPQRKAAVDNLTIALLQDLIPAIGAMQILPGEAQRASRSAKLVLTIAGSAWAQRQWSSMVQQVSGGGAISIIIGADGCIWPVRDPYTGAYRGFFPAVCSSDVPRPSPYQSYVPPAGPGAGVSVPNGRIAGCVVPALPCPGLVTVKIRGLASNLQRQDTIAIFLRASGYAEEDYDIVSVFNPPVYGFRTAGGVRAGTPRNANALFAQVRPPADDPGLSCAVGRWEMPGHNDSVVVTVRQSLARAVKGVPPPAPQIPFDTLLLKQVPLVVPPQQPDVRAATAAATKAVAEAAAAGVSLLGQRTLASRLGRAMVAAPAAAAAVVEVAAAGAAAAEVLAPGTAGGAGPSVRLPFAGVAPDAELADGAGAQRGGVGVTADSSSDDGVLLRRSARDRRSPQPFWLGQSDDPDEY